MKTEDKIVRLFIEEPDSKTIREISKRIRSDYKITHTAAKRLLDRNILLSKKVGKSELCSLNNSYYGYEMYKAEDERREKFLENRDVRQLYKEVMDKVSSNLFIFLVFGSYAKGNQTKNSDIDMMFISNEKGFEERVSSVLSLMLLKTHSLVFTEEEFIRMISSSKSNVVKEAVQHNIILFGIESYYRMKNALKESKDKGVNDNAVLNLWPSYTLKEVLKNPLFYEQPIAQPPTMNSHQFLSSLRSKNVSQEIIENLSLVDVEYRGFDNEIYRGQVIIHKEAEYSIIKIFKRILSETNFPITSVFPISMFNWNMSSKLNNCGAFDWRFVENSDEISDHSFGAAIDINPVLNPWVRKGLPNSPNYPYDPNKRGALHANSDVVKIFKEEGWKWGGDWKNSKDWMHFYRPDIPYKYFGKVEVEE